MDRSAAAARMAPAAGAVTAVAVGLMLRQMAGAVGLGEATDIYAAGRLAGVLTLAATLSFWAGRLTGRLPLTAFMGVLAGAAAASFAHEPAPAVAGLVILGFLALRILLRVVSWAFLYVWAVLFGVGLGLGAHYLIEQGAGPQGYLHASVLVVAALAVAGFFILRFGAGETSGRFQLIYGAWIRLNRLALFTTVLFGVSASLYGLKGVDLEQLAADLRQPIEQGVADFRETQDKVERARDVHREIERFLPQRSESDRSDHPDRL